jgi:hypothetical protein
MPRTFDERFDDFRNADGAPVTKQAVAALLDGITSAEAEGVSVVEVTNIVAYATQMISDRASSARTERLDRERNEAHEAAAREEAAERPIAPVQSAALGDISEPWKADAPTAGQARADHGPANEYDDEDYFDEEESHPVNLVATIEGALSPEQITELLSSSVIPTLAEAVGAYEVDDTDVSVPSVTVLSLRACGDSDPAVYGLRPGSVVAKHSTDVDGVRADVTVTIAGEVDLENPPENPVDVINRAIEDREADEPTEAPTGIVIEFSRLDNLILSDEDLAAPIEEARKSLSSLLGNVLVESVEPADNTPVRRVRLALGGGGDLATRAMQLSSVQFRGTKRFDGVGVFAEAAGTY